MTLNFATHFNDGQPTYFMWQIINSLIVEEIVLEDDIEPYLLEYERRFGNDYIPHEYFTKIHTIREDKADRWKPGMNIHFTIGNRTPERFQFAPVIPVISTQKIVITKSKLPVLGDNSPTEVASIQIDGKDIDDYEASIIASFDGFGLDDDRFWDFWPSGRFEGKIIHWTYLKYEF
jgi:hypothetical protein